MSLINRNGMSCSESGKLGAEKTKIINQRLKDEREKNYNENPNRCKYCDGKISYANRINTFCNHVCSAKYGGLNRVFEPKKDTRVKTLKCIVCGKDVLANIRASNVKCMECKQIENIKPFVEKICDKCENKFKTCVDGKNICIDCRKKNNVCKNCGKICSRIFCNIKCNVEYKWKLRKQKIEQIGVFANGDKEARRFAKKYLIERDGHKCSRCGNKEWMGELIPLISDHIDGDHTNNKIENFRLVCGNCNMQLPTFAGKNRGKGREWRKNYYRTGNACRLKVV